MKKASEMAFQQIHMHEAFVFHFTGAVFCNCLVWSAFEASRFSHCEARGEPVASLDVLFYMETDWLQMHGDVPAQAESKPVDTVFVACCL